MNYYHYTTNLVIDDILAEGVLRASCSVDAMRLLYWTSNQFFERGASYGKNGGSGFRTRVATALCVDAGVPAAIFQEEVSKCVIGTYKAEGLSFFRFVVDDNDRGILWLNFSDFGVSAETQERMRKTLGWKISADVSSQHWLAVESLDFKTYEWTPFEWRIRRDLALLYAQEKVLNTKK